MSWIGHEMTKKDWDTLPAPAPWKNFSKLRYGTRAELAVILWTPCVIMLAFWIWMGFLYGNFFSVGMMIFLLVGSGSLIIGSVMQYRLYQESTDGTDNWVIIPPRSSDLCVAMETAFDDMLKTGGIQYSPGKLKTETINSITNRQYGRNYIVQLGSNGPIRSYGFQKEPNTQGLVLDFAYRPGNKFLSPYLTIELRGITRANYDNAVMFQKRVVATLERLDYQSYPDQLRQ
jgi:hypothetical protein